jgi:hypothetical protein
MAKQQKSYNSRPRQSKANQVGNSVSVAPRAEYRDFGLLTVRSMKQKQSQAQVFKDASPTNFSRMTGEQIIRIIQGTDLAQIRNLSKYYSQTNGIYARAVRYLADLYRFDFMIYPNLDLNSDEELQDEKQVDKILKKFNEVLEHFDSSFIQMQARKWACQVVLEGVYFGYICDDINDKLCIQDLPTNYCRSRFYHRGRPIIEFNVKYFDKITNDQKVREQLLALFPQEIQDGYRKQTRGELPAETQGDDAGWIILDLQRAFKFNFYDNDYPPLLHVIPALINLAEVQDLEKEKLLQELQKILVQTFGLDKNGQIPFTLPELQRLNQNAIDMVGDAVGISVLSTVAEVHLEDLTPEKGRKSDDTVNAAEMSAYNDMGISMNLFNTEGNLALEKSIITDEAYVKQLVLQFERFFNEYIEWKFSKNTLKFRMKMLTTTIFNHIEVSDKYKDLTKLGYSRFLPMVALGHTQKELISMAKLEQQIMEIDNWMLPPFSSNTMSSDTWSDIKTIQQTGGIRVNQGGGQSMKDTAIADLGGDTGGRPEKPNDQKSEKTIANGESKS